MQFTSLFVTLLLSSAVMAKGNKTKAVTDKSLCKDMAKLTKLVDLAANTTKLESKTDNNATKIAEIQAKASTAATELKTMEANTTLTGTCAVIAAAEKVEDDCDDMEDMTKLVALVANATALEIKSKGNATKAEKLQAKASSAAVTLKEMSTNTTLVAACSSITAEKVAKKEAKAAQKAASESASGTAAAAKSTASATTTNAAMALNARTGGVLSTVVLVVAAMIIL